MKMYLLQFTLTGEATRLQARQYWIGNLTAVCLIGFFLIHIHLRDKNNTTICTKFIQEDFDGIKMKVERAILWGRGWGGVCFAL